MGSSPLLSVWSEQVASPLSPSGPLDSSISETGLDNDFPNPEGCWGGGVRRVGMLDKSWRQDTLQLRATSEKMSDKIN